jgi:hypothetical protein
MIVNRGQVSLQGLDIKANLVQTKSRKNGAKKIAESYSTLSAILVYAIS